MPRKKIRLGLIQVSMGEEPEANLGRAMKKVRTAADCGAQIVCLPELFTTPYFPQYAGGPSGSGEPVPGPTTDRLSELARECGIVLVGGSLLEDAGDRRFNTAVVFGPDGALLGRYRKTHIPHDPHFYEQDYFSPGDTGFQVFPTPFGRVSVLICYDQWFPEAARSVALMGADLVVYPTAIGTVRGVRQREGNWHRAWETVMRGHAIANGVVVAAVNRCGEEERMRFWGGSFVCDAFGGVLQRAGLKEEIVIADIDPDHAREVREGWRFFHNRRPECYGPIIAPREGPHE